MKSPQNKWFSLAILLTAPLLSVIDVFIINVAIPSIKKGLQANDAEVQLMIAGYLLSYATFQITSGRMGDHFGRKKMFFWGMFFFTLTSCLCGFSNSPLELNISRFLQGISAAMMLPQTIAIIQVIFPEPKDRTKAIGILGITLGVASILGQFLGGYLSESHFIVAGWRLIFFINLPVGLLSLFATWKYLRETHKNREGRFDYGGVILLTIALVCLIVPLIIGREKKWPAWSFYMFTFSAIIFIYFIRNQKDKLKKGKSPLIDMRLFKIKDFNIGLLAVVFYFMMHSAFLLFVTVYLQNGLGYTPYDCGLFFVIFGCCFTLSSFISIRAVIRFGKRVLQAGSIIILCAFLLQNFCFAHGVANITLFSLMALYGMGAGLVLPSLMNMALKSVPQHFAGAASGVYSTFQQASAALGVSVIGGLFYYTADNVSGVPMEFDKAYHVAMYAEICCIVIVFYLLYLLPDKKSKLS